MRKLVSITLLGMLVLSAGCIRSLHPIYTDKDLVFEPSLIGQWAEDNDREMWAFSKKGSTEYNLVYTDDKGRQGAFSVHLLKIKGNLFLDFLPEEPDLKENAFYQAHLLPVHTFAHVKQIEPTLQMRFPDPEWLKKLVKEKPGAIRHERIEKEIILTAGTKELQAFWLRHLETEGAFGDASNMKRQTSTIVNSRLHAGFDGVTMFTDKGVVNI